MKNIKNYLFLVLLTFFLIGCGNKTNSIENNKPKYTITFFSDGGTLINPIVEVAGTTINLPTPIKAGGYNFLGWYKDYGTYNNRFNDTKMPNENLTLYAKWQKLTNSDLQAYEDELNSNSQANHLYIHYKRFAHSADDYDKWNLWIWAFTKTGREFEWNTSQTSKVVYDDIGGAVADIDLTKTYNDGGNAKNETINYMNNGELIEKIGFLIVYKDSKNVTGKHWLSDGGDTYLSVKAGKRANGSIHIFAYQDNVYDFTYHVSEDEVNDPYKDDDGTNTSDKYSNVNSSTSTYGIAATSPEFQNVGVGYQVMTASFADSDGDGMGDIKGITENLNYLSNTLHVNSLWLTPIQLSDSYHGYDIIDYSKVDPKFGSKNTNFKNLLDEEGNPTCESAMEDYKELLKEAKKLNIKIIMDLVINHTSLNNVWFIKSAKMAIEDGFNYRAMYQWKNHISDTSVATNNNWHQYSTYSYSYYGKFASSMPELNYDYQGTRDHIIDMAKNWLELGVSGFRIDAVKHIYMADEVTKSSNDTILEDFDTATSTDYSSNVTKNVNFFKEFNFRLKENHPNAVIIGENFDGHAYRVAPYYEGLDSMLDFYSYYNLSQAVAAPNGWQLGNKFSGGGNADSFNPSSMGLKYGGKWNYPGVNGAYEQYRNSKAINSQFTSNHDVARVMNNVIGTVNGGDLTPGTVTSSNSTEAIKKAKVYSAAVLTLSGISWIYYGDELGMSGNLGASETKTSPHSDRWTRQPFKWGSNYETAYTTKYTFSGDKTYSIEWDSYNANLQGMAQQKNDTNSILSEYIKLTTLKSSDSVLIKGDYEAINTGNDVMAFKRIEGSKTYYIYHNFGSTTVNVSITGSNILYSLNGATKTSLPGYSSIIVAS